MSHTTFQHTTGDKITYTITANKTGVTLEALNREIQYKGLFTYSICINFYRISVRELANWTMSKIFADDIRMHSNEESFHISYIMNRNDEEVQISLTLPRLQEQIISTPEDAVKAYTDAYELSMVERDDSIAITAIHIKSGIKFVGYINVESLKEGEIINSPRIINAMIAAKDYKIGRSSNDIMISFFLRTPYSHDQVDCILYRETELDDKKIMELIELIH